MNQQQLCSLLRSLRSETRESECVEFKRNNTDPEQIGQYLSALANSAALLQRQVAYLVWGIEDGTHNVVGTNFRPREAKKGNEQLENWLLSNLDPKIDVKIHEFKDGGLDVVIFEIQPASSTPVAFLGTRYIRIGSVTKPLGAYPEKERALWELFSSTPFEKGIAAGGISSDEVLRLIDYTHCFEMLKLSLPDNRPGILDRLCREKVILARGDDQFEITNVGAILFAKSLAEFERLGRKALRVIQYKDKDRTETIREQGGDPGYAVGFERTMQFISNLLPQNEQIEQALRKSVPLFPLLAIRELVANALIHQDFAMVGTGPTVEIFTDRIEITNPGKPLIDTLRFIDEPPQSRNEALASQMRRLNICEERGSGVDKVIRLAELCQLPAPEFVETTNHTKAILFAPRKLNEMDPKDRVRACYQHACLLYVSNEQMTNSSFRDRLGVDQKNYATVSRIIRESIDAGMVRAVDSTTSKRYMKYVPFWA